MGVLFECAHVTCTAGETSALTYLPALSLFAPHAPLAAPPGVADDHRRLQFFRLNAPLFSHDVQQCVDAVQGDQGRWFGTGFQPARFVFSVRPVSLEEVPRLRGHHVQHVEGTCFNNTGISTVAAVVEVVVPCLGRCVLLCGRILVVCWSFDGLSGRW